MLGQITRWHVLHQAHGRANMLHRPPLSPSRAFCAPARWRQAQHKRCRRLCTTSRSARNIRGWQLQRFSARRLRGGFASAIPHPIFGRAVIVKPSVNHQLVLPWIGGKIPRAHGIAVRQKMTSGLDKSFKTSPMEMLVVIQRSHFQKKLINALILLVEPLAVFVVLYPVFHGKSPCQLLV